MRNQPELENDLIREMAELLELPDTSDANDIF